MESVQGVVGEGLHVLQVGGVAGCAGGFEGGEDVIAGGVEDPFSVVLGWGVSFCGWVGLGWVRGAVGVMERAGKSYRILSTPAHLSWACWRANCRRSPSWGQSMRSWRPQMAQEGSGGGCIFIACLLGMAASDVWIWFFGLSDRCMDGLMSNHNSVPSEM